VRAVVLFAAGIGGGTLGAGVTALEERVGPRLQRLQPNVPEDTRHAA